MIKIIKAGTRNEATCDKCGCLFSYEAEDIQKWHSNSEDVLQCRYREYIACPQCLNKVFTGKIVK